MSSETLYKYRSLDNWKFLIDILINQRLFAAHFETLNDPMEGRFFYDEGIPQDYRDLIIYRKQEWRICSLTRNPRNTLMWSYYGGEHKGLALEFTVPRRKHQIIRPVNYDYGLHLQPQHTQSALDDVAVQILSQKMSNWHHEDEVRVFTQHDFIDIRLSKIILGCRVAGDDRRLIRSLVRKADLSIPVHTMKHQHLDAAIPF
ncbi:MAG: DUF2971 domain-containing protein [Woeseiaceae bacterium]